MSGQERGAGRLERLSRYRAARQAQSPRTSLAAFEALVEEAVDTLPPYVRARMENVAVVVAERPDPHRVRSMGFAEDQDLLGLYEGTPRPQRAGWYHLAVPDRITIYRQPILDQVGAGNRAAILQEVRQTVIHEVAHHFGFTDPELEQLERGERRR